MAEFKATVHSLQNKEVEGLLECEKVLDLLKK